MPSADTDTRSTETIAPAAARPAVAGTGGGAGERVLRFLGDLGFAAVAVVAAWWLAVLVFAPEPFILPGPDRVAARLASEAPFLLAEASVTLLEMTLGLLCGTLLGVATALAMAAFGPVGRVLKPLIVVSQALPVFAVAPLLVVWFGYGLASKVVMATLIIYFPVASALHDGLRRTDPGLLDLATLAGASRLATLRLVRFPAALPALVSGVRLAASVAPIGAVVGEWVGASRGLGFVMLQAFARFQTDTVFAALAVLAVLALVFRLAVDEATRRLVPWLPETD